MKITENTLYVDGMEVELPEVSRDAVVRAWRVPVEYRESGIFVTVTVPGEAEEMPACAPEQAELLGEVTLPASEAAALRAAKSAKRGRVAELCEQALSELASSYPPGELQSWPQQVKEAEAVDVDPQAQAPLLQAIAAARGIGVPELARRVLEKAQAYAAASGAIIGRRQAAEDQIDAAETMQQLEGIEC